jgi:hypothetical protein
MELLRRRWCARVDFADETLHVHLLGSLYQPALSPQVAAAQLFLILKQLRIPRLEQVEICAFRGSRLLWRQSLKLGSRQRWDRFSFDNWAVNAWAYPAAFAVALMVNNIGLLQLLHLPLHIWIHEFGHATVAWWSGYRALPLPIGWTSVSSQRDPFVYFGILFITDSTLLVSPQGADWVAAGAGHLSCSIAVLHDLADAQSHLGDVVCL